MLHTVLLDFNNDIYTTGYNRSKQLGLNSLDCVFEFTKIVNFKAIKIFPTILNTFILTEHNELFGVGSNENGILGTLGSENFENNVSEFIKINLPYCNKNMQTLKTFCM